jgi:hypothetical protein
MANLPFAGVVDAALGALAGGAEGVAGALPNSDGAAAATGGVELAGLLNDKNGCGAGAGAGAGD